MTLLGLLASAFLIGLSGAVMPGPLLTVTIAAALRRGWRAPLWLVAGHGLLELAVVLALAVGLGRFVAHPAVLRGTALVGGAVLVWMGYGAFRTAQHPETVTALLNGTTAAGTEPTAGASAMALAATGAAVSVSNPYWIVWWATIGVTYVLRALEQGSLGLPAFFVGHISSDAAWFVGVGIACAAGRGHLSPGLARGILSACGLVLCGFGALFLLAGLGLVGNGLVAA